MTIVSRIRRKTYKPATVYLFYFLHKRIFCTNNKRHIVIGKSGLCRHHYLPSTTCSECPFRIYNRQGEWRFHKRINLFKMCQFEELHAKFIKAAHNLHILNTYRRKELDKQLMFVWNGNLQRSIRIKRTTATVIKDLTWLTGQKHRIRAKPKEVLLTNIKWTILIFRMQIINTNMRYTACLNLTIRETVFTDKLSSVTAIGLNRHKSG